MRNGRSTGSERAALVCGFLLALIAIVLRVVSRGIVEMGDGVQHYMQARYCWAHPELLHDLWGKPLFMLLASPFAQMGHIGMTVFNAAIGVAMVIMMLGVMRRAGGMAQLLFPLLVMLAPFYLLMVLGGMTEILFGGLAVLTIMLLFKDRPVAAAVVASLMPFSRPEYVAFLPFVVAWLVLSKQWRALPFCLTGWVIFSAIMWAVADDPLWFWTHAPYKPGPSIYGSGDLFQFVRESPRIFGLPLLLMFISALLLWYHVQRHDLAERRTHRLLFIVGALPVLSVMALHSYIWWRGIHASAGLVRVVVTVVPLAALFALHTLGRAALLWWPLAERRWSIRASIVGVVVALGSFGAWQMVSGPLRRGGDQVALDAAGDALKRAYRPGGLVYTTHPYAAFRADLDPFDMAHYRTVWGLNDLAPEEFFERGALIFWDSQLGPNEGNLPLDTLLKDPHFAVRGVWEPREGHTVYGDRPYEIFLFEAKDVVREVRADTIFSMQRSGGEMEVRMDTLPCSVPQAWCFGQDEFPLHLGKMELTPGGSVIYDELVLEGEIWRENTSPGTFELVFKQAADGDHIRYEQCDITAEHLNIVWRVPPAVEGIEQDLYIWNLARTPFKVKDLRLLRRRWTQRDTVLSR